MKKKYYLVLDTETATLPFANEIAKTAKQKLAVAIAKPLIYDIGWTIIDRKGNIIKTANYIVQETFFVPNIFNTAYYKEKRPQYIEMLETGKAKAMRWNEIALELMNDLDFCSLACAYNACFDFKKAIPFTDKYIRKLYSAQYQKWEDKQYKKCLDIVNGVNESENPEYLTPLFQFRGKGYPIADLWGVACSKLINGTRYKDYCLKNNLLTQSAQFFKTSAETSYQYLLKNHDFIEEHTALSDSLIEAKILTKALKKGKVEPEIKAFPFRELGTTFKYVQEKPKYKQNVLTALEKYIVENNGYIKADNGEKYWKRMVKTLENL